MTAGSIVIAAKSNTWAFSKLTLCLTINWSRTGSIGPRLTDPIAPPSVSRPGPGDALPADVPPVCAPLTGGRPAPASAARC